MDAVCLFAQLLAHLSIFITIMWRYNRLKAIKNRPMSLIASLLAGVSLAAAVRIALTWPEPVTFLDYFESVIVVAMALHIMRCRGHMTRILWVNQLNALR